MSVLRLSPTQQFALFKTSELVHLQNASCQRLLNPDRVEELTTELLDQLNQQRQPWLPQCLCVARCQETDYLIDGQHRLAAYMRILQETKEDLLVCVNTIEVTEMSHMECLFRLVNRSVPVARLPEGVSFADTNNVLSHYLQSHGFLFSDCVSRKPRKPRLHRQTFEEFVAEVKRLCPTTNVIELLDAFHKSCQHKTWKFFQRSASETSTKVQQSLNKCQGFYLGMFPPEEWLSLVCHIEPHAHLVRSKKRIPKALRMAVWNKYIGKLVRSHKCPFEACDEIISVENFHCAHDMAEVLGGDLTVDNLYPCCGSCNLSMGRVGFETFAVCMSTNITK